MYCFKSSNDFCCSGPHSTFAAPRKTLKKSKLLYACLAMNLFNATMRLINLCTSFLVCGGCIWRIAFILLGLALMPLVDTKQPSTLPRVTPKTHFFELSLSLASHILAKVSVRLDMYKVIFLLATTMSSTYESTFLPTWSFNAAFVILQMWDLRCASPPTFSYSNMCQIVL
jgi:hypothetical protein